MLYNLFFHADVLVFWHTNIVGDATEWQKNFTYKSLTHAHTHTLAVSVRW